MCGIAGVLNLREAAPIGPELLCSMVGAMRHRGPDESGVYLDAWAGLGNARLTIVDLASGTQPICNEDESLWIVYNGEVFNYPELRGELIARGHRFTTTTDTEVVLHLFEEKGAAALHQLNGQWALAIWDSRKRSLFLARDRIGIRPLFYSLCGGRLYFASEIKALLASGQVAARLDSAALSQVFTYWSTLPGRTMLEGISELPAGHWLRVQDGRLELVKYWEPSFAAPADCEKLPEPEIRERVHALIDDAVRIRLRADVPVGCYLSGGLDSSGIAAILAKKYNHDVRTFGIRFDDPDFDEGPYQRRMVEFLGVDHTEVEATHDRIGASLPDTIWHCETPLLRTAPVPLFLLSETVRDHGFKVVLAGEGGDEVFAGYNIFREALIRRAWIDEPDPARRHQHVETLYPYIFKRDPKLKHLLASFFGQGLDSPDDPFFSHRVRWRNTARIRTFLSPEVRALAEDGSEALHALLPPGFERWDTLSQAQLLEMRIFLSNYLLSSQGDRVAMAHSVEVRVPYLDYRLIEFMGRVGSELKMRELCEKHILKQVLRGELPGEIVDRPKQPYRAPIKKSLLATPQPWLAEALSPSMLASSGLFDAGKVAMLQKKMQGAGAAGETDNMALVGITTTQLFWQQFINRFPWRETVPARPDRFIDRRVEKLESPRRP